MQRALSSTLSLTSAYTLWHPPDCKVRLVIITISPVSTRISLFFFYLLIPVSSSGLPATSSSILPPPCLLTLYLRPGPSPLYVIQFPLLIQMCRSERERLGFMNNGLNKYNSFWLLFAPSFPLPLLSLNFCFSPAHLQVPILLPTVHVSVWTVLIYKLLVICITTAAEQHLLSFFGNSFVMKHIDV